MDTDIQIEWLQGSKLVKVVNENKDIGIYCTEKSNDPYNPHRYLHP